MGTLVLASVKCCQFVPSIFFQGSCDIYCRAGQRLKGLFISIRVMPRRSWSLAECKDQQPAPQPHGEMQSLEKEEEEGLQILTSRKGLC